MRITRVIIYKERTVMKKDYQAPNLQFVVFDWAEIVRTSQSFFTTQVFFDKNYFFDRENNGFGNWKF